MRLRRALVIGLLIATFQTVLACAMTGVLKGPRSFPVAYTKLCQWDCAWYESVARDGYRSSVPPVAQNKSVSNVAFFPGYPYLARVLHLGTGLSPRMSLLLVAQVFAVLFWAALHHVLQRWRIPPRTRALALLSVLAHPASAFLVSGYSESMFLFLLVVFVSYGTLCAPTALSGFALSATRIVGVSAAAAPLVRVIIRAMARGKAPGARAFWTAAGAAAAAVSGAAAFLIYCQWRFGRYDLYLETQRIGWGVSPDYGAIWKWRSFRFFSPLDRVSTWGSGLGFLALGAIEGAVGWGRGLRTRLPIYAAAALMFFITLSGLKNVGFLSMIRYSLTWYVLWVLCLSHLSTRVLRSGYRWPRAFTMAAQLTLAAGLAMLLWRYQLPHLREFLQGRWFA